MDRKTEKAVQRGEHIPLSSSSNNLHNNKGKGEMDSSIEIDTTSSSYELPFLVTHWLATYDCKIPRQRGQTVDSKEANNAIHKIHRAAAEIASAFSTLSSFGTNVPLTPLEHDPLNRQSQQKTSNRTYGELKRQWGKHCPPNQLEILVNAAQSVNGAVESAIKQKKVTTTEFATNIGMAAREKVIAAIHKPNSGRTLLDSADKEFNPLNDVSYDINSTTDLLPLHPPILLSNETDTKTTKDITGKDPSITIQSSYRKAAIEASSELRQLIEVRIKLITNESRLRSLNRSMGYHKKIMTDLIQRRNLVLARQSQQSLETTQTSLSTNGSDLAPQVPGERDYGSLLTELDDIDNEEQNCKRVIAQLEREIPGVARLRDEDLRKIAELQKRSQVLFERTKDIYINYNDPIPKLYGKERFSSNRLLFNLQTRQMGCIDRCNGRNLPVAMGRKRPLGAHIENQKAILYNRFSYAATINSHLHYPVYCLRFDRTGRYFITGADDYLVRVFCLGENVVPKAHGKLARASFMRGAVLVCTLKGHAGVVNDICVSSDNSFLATASDDGDCRVWGLRDGTPVAILRGHEGGANMVSWSSLTPYRLVTTSADGLARIWDIREACLNRYGNLVRKRAEYSLKLDGVSIQAILATSNPKSLTENETAWNQGDDNGHQLPSHGVPLPPLPQNANAENAPLVESINGRGNVAEQQHAVGNLNNAEDQTGNFVFNDMIDQGVKLIAKLQHGASRDERTSAPGTRARQSTVKVICVARCPFGGHFATGSDDGICRIWRDDDDILVERIDAELCGRHMANQLPRHTTRKNSDPLLLVLEGHHSAITDLAYSSSGDRILSASQKDGLVQICSWSSDPSLSNKPGGIASPSKRTPGSSISKISIKLVSPRLAVTSLSAPKRRANSKPPASHIACDVATWVQDDSKVATSQSELVKANGSDIVPGSHYIFLWESSTGHCLLGIAGAHTKPCPLLIAHPTDSSIMCSASADGMVKIWDWESCKCLYSHANTATFGPLEDEQLGKNLGYLDGSFSPDGTKLVLTDDSGRITVLDCNTQANNGERSGTDECPIWMKEQYFSNDYYDLIYDNTGYCVEKGSEQPPHLAPRGSRCSHTGAAVEAVVNETFSGLYGPLPLSEESCRWNREEIRSKAEAMIAVTQGFQGNFIRQYDPHTTIMLQDGMTKSIASIGDATVHDVETARPIASTNVNNQPNGRTGRLLSRNYRWGDAYEDAIRAGDDGPEIESDDEEYEINERASAVLNDEDLDDSMQSDDDLSPVNRPANANIAELAAPRARASSRKRRSLFESEGDSDDDDAEFLSTNNHPTGIFASDYNVHFFKLPGRTHVSRLWLRRLESISSREGRKKYSPQIGDLVVYIPRAHLDTVHNFPILFAPWLHWPNDARWPVVECKIRNVRYRFPFVEFWTNKISGKTCRSVVAILTLEVVGIPETVDDRDHPWPKPEFAPTTTGHLFEVCVFENRETEFIIPSTLYKTRLRNLEYAMQGGYSNERPKIQVYYESDKNLEDDEFQSFSGTLRSIHDEADISSIPKLQGSGYNSVTVEWSNGQKDKVNPWEINVIDTAVPKFSKLDDSVKKLFAEKIMKLKDDYSVFSNPVDEARYSDYLMRVEVPMDLSYMLKRLENDYYVTKFSVIADMRLIVENCAKYNGEHDGLTRVARRMLDDFETSLLSPDDRKSFHEFNVPLKVPSSAEVSTDVRQQSEHAASSVPQRSRRVSAPRRESRYNQPLRSSLELLPQPEESHVRRPVSSRRQFRSHAQSGNGNEGQQRGLHNQPRNQNENRDGLGRRRPNARTPDRANLSARPSNTIRIRLSVSQSRTQQAVDDRTQSSQSRTMIPLQELPRDDSLVEHVPSVPTADSLQSSNAHGISDEKCEELPRSSDSLFEQMTNGNRKRNRGQAPQTRLQTGDSLAELAIEGSFDDQDNNTPPAKKNCVFDEKKPQARFQNHSPDSTYREGAPLIEPCSTLAQYSSQQNPTDAEDDYVDERESSARNEHSENSRSNHGRRALRRKVVRNVDNRGDGMEDSDDDSANESSKGSIHTGFSSSSNDDASDDNDNDNQSDESSKLQQRKRSPRKRNPKRSDDSTKPYKQNGHTPKAKAQSPPRKKPSSGQLTSKNSPPRRMTSRRSTSRKLRKSAAPQKSYVDPSSSEFDSIVGGSSDSESEDKPPSKQRAGQQGGRRKADSKGTTPVIKEWPEISPRYIPRVARAIISRLTKLDTLGLFAAPVLETYPDLLVAYRLQVKQPMDFRTISQDRIPGYTSINDLRSDLILTFKNCIAFNGEDSEEGVESWKLLSSMYEIFKVVCDLNFITMRQED